MKISEKEKKKLYIKLYQRDGENCHYCGIKEGDFIPLWGKFYEGRGERLEVERKDNERGYSEENCVLACAICNNAKSNKFTCEEFEKVGEAIKEIWLSKKDKNFKKEAKRKMYPKYKCFGCGRIWRDKGIMVVCPVCRCKPIKIKDGVDINEVVKNIKGGEKIEQKRIQKNNLGTTK